MYFALHCMQVSQLSIPFGARLHRETSYLILLLLYKRPNSSPNAEVPGHVRGRRARVASIFAPSQELLQVRRIRIKLGLWPASTRMGTNGRLAGVVIHDSRLLTKRRVRISRARRTSCALDFYSVPWAWHPRSRIPPLTRTP